MHIGSQRAHTQLIHQGHDNSHIQKLLGEVKVELLAPGRVELEGLANPDAIRALNVAVLDT